MGAVVRYGSEPGAEQMNLIGAQGGAVKKFEHITILGSKEPRYTAAIPAPSLDGIAGVDGLTVPALF